MAEADTMTLPAVKVSGPDGSVPVKQLDDAQMRVLAGQLQGKFQKFSTDRLIAERRWLKNLRQYLGIYDPEVVAVIPKNMSQAYPKLTRVKCVSTLSRMMRLMFPGNDRNWELTASPSAEMDPNDVQKAVMDMVQQRQQDGLDTTIDDALVEAAVQDMANRQAASMTKVVDDQLTELGFDQTPDWIALNRKVSDSGIRYGLGMLQGPFVRTVVKSGWAISQQGQFVPTERTLYKPQFDFLPVWDFYPDMSSKTLPGNDGYFIRKVLGETGFRALADRPDFFSDQIKNIIRMNPNGNYRQASFESELKIMGVAVNTPAPNDQNGRDKYEIRIWNGPVTASELMACGVDVPEKFRADSIEAEIWLCGNDVIKADINPWRRMGLNVKTVHCFVFDEDDTSPVGSGLPQIVRDSQLGLCAVTRMSLDNASVVCGPSLEINLSLMQSGQDFTSHSAYKNYYRDDDNPLSAQYPAVREIKIDSHLQELQVLTKQFLDFAEMETFVGPLTGGDMSKVPSEAMRTVGGNSMLRNDAALPFQDVVRHYDTFTQSVISALVAFNKKLNPDIVPGGDYCVIARGATSLIAKEAKAAAADQLAQTLTPDDRDHIDDRKFLEERVNSRDLGDILVDPYVAKHRKEMRSQQQAQDADKQDRMFEAQERVELSTAFKNMTQGQKNSVMADAATVKTALDMLEKGAGETDGNTTQGTGPQSGGTAAQGG